MKLPRSVFAVLAVLIAAIAPAFGRQAASNIASGSAINFETARLSKVAAAVRIAERITLDGRMEEPAWKLAIPATDFIQNTPRNGERSPEHTEVRFLYDDDNLYVSFICLDSDAAHMVVTQLKEDYDSNTTDGISVIIDSLYDRRSGFTFSTNPAGAKRDYQISNVGAINPDWDGVWDVKVVRNGEGWVAEFEIPFKTLRFSESPTQVWGLNLTRKIFRRNEESSWAPTPPRYRANRMDLAGTLVGLENIHQGRNLKIKPFAIATMTQAREGGQLRTIQRLDRFTDNPVGGYLGGYDGGVDLKYSLTPSLTLDGTYHTDFAQVEVDQQQVNLTRFNLFFPEKRDFFLENSGTFGFSAGGSTNASGNLSPFYSRRIGLSPTGNPIPIAGGARVSGKVNQYDLGFLAMKTEASKSRTGQILTPSNNYFVGRMKRDLFASSYIGGILTSRDSTVEGDYNRVYGTDAYFQFSRRLEFDAYFLKSDTPDRLRSGKNLAENQARKFAAAWRDDEVVVAAEYNTVQPNFNPEVGFVRRGNATNYSADLAWNPLLEDSDLIKNLRFVSSLDYFADPKGNVETRAQNVTLGINFENNGTLSFGVDNTFDRLVRPFPIRTNISIPAGDYGYAGYTGSFSTDQRSKIIGNGTINWGEFWNGRRKSLIGGLKLRPNYHVNLDLDYNRNQVRLPNGEFTTDLVSARLVYGFTPRAFFNAFVQYNADTHQVSSNIRFNFTHHPLSDVYLVYNDRRDTSAGELVERSFIVKFTNLFNF